MAGLFRPTWTPNISGENGISELREVEINHSSLEIMVRGNNRDNPIVLFVHGGLVVLKFRMLQNIRIY